LSSFLRDHSEFLHKKETNLERRVHSLVKHFVGSGKPEEKGLRCDEKVGNCFSCIALSQSFE
jgi:hypothetical protein